jgi:hypothetical protein
MRLYAATMDTLRAPRFERLFAALPDAITSGVFAWIWLYPFALGEGAVRNAMLVMLVEFILVHASGFLGVTVLADTVARSKRIMVLLGFGLFYLLFIGIFMTVFREWWPLAAFGWLLFGKFAGVIGKPASSRQRLRIVAGWGLSVLFYIVGAFATILLPIPQLGIGDEIIPALGLTGSGLWVEQPHRVVAFGTLYFALTAWSKWRDWAFGTATGT